MNLSMEDKQWVDKIWQAVSAKLERNAAQLKDIIPYTTTNGKYTDMSKEDVGWWTNGFFGGMMWLMYNETKKECFKIAAENQEKILDGVFDNYDRFDHDIGFMWGLTAKANYILNGDKKSRARSLYAANILAARANIRANFIRAWNGIKEYSIIDCMMNLPILYWASEEIKDNRFKFIAQMHADMAMKEHVREDGSVVHICVHDDETPEIIRTEAGQGYAVGSAWTRGQSWAVYGFVLSYLYTKDEKYLETAKKTADYFIENVKKANYKTVTDFCAPSDAGLFDNSAGACAACGMIELYKITKDEKYLDSAVKILKAMEEDLILDDSNQSIVQKGMLSYSDGKHVDLIYADFFLCEALLKLKGSDYLIW